MTERNGERVNRVGLAGVFGVHVTTIDSWVRLGCPAEQKGGRGKEWVFDTAAVARWREQRAAEDAGGDVAQDIDAIRLRKLRAEAMTAELELLQKQALVAPVDQIERMLSRVLAEIQNNLRGSLVTRLATQLLGETDERKFKRIALAEIDVVLESLATLDVTDDSDPAAIVGGD